MDKDGQIKVSDKYSLQGRVFNRLREDILSGKYKENDELREMTIGAELGVSRTPAYSILKGVIMRLDKYLKVSRIIKRRTVANEACDAGRVLVNDKPAKASVNVKVGDIIEILFGTKSLKVEVLDISETVKKDEAKEMYREL